MEILDSENDYKTFAIINDLLVYFLNDKEEGYRMVLCRKTGAEGSGIVIRWSAEEIKKLFIAIGDLLVDSLEWD